MTLEKLRAALAAVATTVVAVAGASCAHDRAHHKDTVVAGRQLGDSTASPGDDPDRPVARSVDTQEVSTTISRVPSPPAPAPSPSPTPAGTPPPYPMPPQQVPPVAIPPVATPPPASPTSPATPAPTPPAGGSPGAFAPPPPPPPAR